MALRCEARPARASAYRLRRRPVPAAAPLLTASRRWPRPAPYQWQRRRLSGAGDGRALPWQRRHLSRGGGGRALESNSLPGRIQVSEATYVLLRDLFDFEERGPIEVKGKGQMPVYLLVGPKDDPGRASLDALAP
jgi:hypothetical protein